MANNNIIREDVLTDIGGTITYNSLDYVNTYVLSGTAVLGGDWTITSSAGDVRGTTYNIRYVAAITLGAFNISIFGVSLNVSQALKQATISVYYDGSSYQVDILPDFQDSQIVTTNNIVNNAVTTIKLDQTGGSQAVTTATIRDLNVTTGKIAANAITTAKLDVTGGSEAVTTATLRDLNVTSAKLGNLAVTTAKIDDLAVTTNKLNNLAVTGAKIADTTVSFAKLDSSVTSLLNTTGIESATVSLSAADISTLVSSPVQIVASPGIGKAIEIISAMGSFTYNSVAYDNLAAIIIGSTAPTDGQVVSNNFILSGASSIIFKFGTDISTYNLVILEDTPIYVSAVGTDPTVGDGTLTIDILYRTITL